MHSSNFKREKFQRLRKLSKCDKIKVSFVFISIFQRCTLETLIFCLSCQQIWLMLYVWRHLCLARTTQFSADHDFHYSTCTKIPQVSNHNHATPNPQMCLGMQLSYCHLHLVSLTCNGHMLDHDRSTKWVCSHSHRRCGSPLLPGYTRILDTPC